MPVSLYIAAAKWGVNAPEIVVALRVFICEKGSVDKSFQISRLLKIKINVVKPAMKFFIFSCFYFEVQHFSKRTS
ncbi:MAG: hypothetical protein Q4G07_09375 [Oscillospiraceae bacterium]|nr:hypothetical protein [Oscillospiraceae bacterium]